MTGICKRTLHNLIDHLACSMNDLEGTELSRIASKQGHMDPDDDHFDDGVTFIATVSDEKLNHIRWSEYFLTSVINDGFRILHLERPDLFASLLRMKLKPNCEIQELPDDCLKFGGYLENTTDCDHLGKVNQPSEEQIRTASKLAGVFCTGRSHSGMGDDPYVVTSFIFDPEMPRVFRVVPPPPDDGKDHYVTISCIGAPPCYDWPEDKDELLGDLTKPMLDIYEPFLLEYALYRAYSTDHESESSDAAAKIHWDNAFHLINEGKRTDYAFYHPDLYLVGPIKEGTGDNILLQTSGQ